MKPEKIIAALNDIDGQYIREAREEPAAGRGLSRRFTVLIAAVIALMAVTMTAFAAEEISGWFRQYFSGRSAVPLTPEQVEFIEENEQIIEETQESSGYTVELKSVLADGQNAYAIIGVTAPADVTREQLEQLSAMGIDIYDENKNPCFTFGFQYSDDRDGIDNTADYLINFTPADWNNGDLWTIRVSELGMNIYDREYEQELLDTKYAGQSNIMFTDEEAARINQYVPLAEGPWKFTFDLSEAASAELELITTPVSALTCYGYKPDGTEVLEEISITSFVLRPLGATVYAESQGALDLTYNADQKIFVVMKDGSQIQLLPAWGAMGEQHLECAAPIVLSEVDYILMPDGAKLPAA